MRILKIQEHHRRKGLLNLTLSNKTSLTLSSEICFKEGISEDKELSDEELSSLKKEESLFLCRQAALNLLKYRPRSEMELRQRLLRKVFQPEAIDKTLNYLRDLSLIDDGAFASLWADSRKTKRSRRLIKQELMRKGIPRDMAEQVTSEIDEESAALALARKRARTLHIDSQNLHGQSSREFQAKIVSHLIQKGFSYDLSRRAARAILSEIPSP